MYYFRSELNIIESSGNLDDKQHDGNDEPFSEQQAEHDGIQEASPTTLAPGQTLHGTGLRLLNPSDFQDRLRQVPRFDLPFELTQPFPNISLETQDVTRWKMAWRAQRVFKDNVPYASLVRRCKDLPDMEDILDEPLIAFGFSAGALMYGGLHALAWFAHFDSSTEQLLWRISACMVMGGLPVIFVLNTGADKLYLMLSSHMLTMGRIAEWSIELLFDLNDFSGPLLAGLIFLAYVLARGYLVVECFINLSHLPAEVYEVPQWSAYFPHIS